MSGASDGTAWCRAEAQIKCCCRGCHAQQDAHCCVLPWVKHCYLQYIRYFAWQMMTALTNYHWLTDARLTSLVWSVSSLRTLVEWRCSTLTVAVVLGMWKSFSSKPMIGLLQPVNNRWSMSCMTSLSGAKCEVWQCVVFLRNQQQVNKAKQCHHTFFSWKKALSKPSKNFCWK